MHNSISIGLLMSGCQPSVETVTPTSLISYHLTSDLNSNQNIKGCMHQCWSTFDHGSTKLQG